MRAQASSSVSGVLARWIANHSFEQIPNEVASDAGYRVMDIFGIQVASLVLPSTRSVLDMISGWGGTPQARLPGVGFAFPAPSAALAGGVMAHSFDFDDTHGPSIIHASAVIVPAAAAAAQAAGLSGREFIAALVAGYEVATRIGVASPGSFHATGLHSTSVLGIFGAVASACYARRLNEAQIRAAFGIAGSQASGLLQALVDGTDAKLFNCGWAAHAAVVAADLAARGFSAPNEVFEGQFGFFPAYLRGQPFDAFGPLADLGSVWHTPTIRYKLYPCCGHLHSFIDAVLDLKRRHGISADQVASVHCEVLEQQVPIICEPRAEKLDPATEYGARFSLPLTIAAALTCETVDNVAYAHALVDERVHDLARRVSYIGLADPDFPSGGRPLSLTLQMRDGRELSARGLDWRGAATSHELHAGLKTKFEANCRGMLSEAQSDAAIEHFMSLAAAPDISHLFELGAGARTQKGASIGRIAT